MATIKTVTGTLNAKKLDINGGLGDGSEEILVDSASGTTIGAYGILMAEFTIAINSVADTAKIQLRDISGIPDRMFGLADNNGDTDTHMFLYLPVVSPATGRTWLNNNLGAHYADMNHAEFSIEQQGENPRDFHAYGSLFQWGRKADGHELINWTGETAGAPVYGNTATNNNDPDHPEFITEGTTPWDWRIDQDDTLEWTNNSCPAGYRLADLGMPGTYLEWEVESESMGAIDYRMDKYSRLACLQ